MCVDVMALWQDKVVSSDIFVCDKNASLSLSNGVKTIPVTYSKALLAISRPQLDRS